MTTSAGSAIGHRREVVPSSVLGMLVFIATEMMFFTGLTYFWKTATPRVPAWIRPLGCSPQFSRMTR